MTRIDRLQPVIGLTTLLLNGPLTPGPSPAGRGVRIGRDPLLKAARPLSRGERGGGVFTG